MNPGLLAVFIPIVMFLVIGAVSMSYLYFRYRERQMLIEKGLSAEEIKLFVTARPGNKYLMTQIGIVSIFLGLGIGIGMLLEDITFKEYWTVLTIFGFTGAGFIIANIIGRRLNG